jgi:predicted transposase/invertase (TIGR01784 family)
MDPKIDFAFKQIFAVNSQESKTVLMALLNAILDRDEDEQITDIIYLNPYTDKPFEDAKQIVAGESYFELNPCIVINILDFNLIRENEHYHSVFDIRERRRGFQLVGDLEIHYLELNKLSGYADATDLTTLEEWLIFIKDAANVEKRELIETIKKRNEVIAMAEKILARASADEFARAAYQQRRKWYLDRVSSEKYLIKQGIEQGGKIKALDIARKMLSLDFTEEQISLTTGLSKEEIATLRKE